MRDRWGKFLLNFRDWFKMVFNYKKYKEEMEDETLQLMHKEIEIQNIKENCYSMVKEKENLILLLNNRIQILNEKYENKTKKLKEANRKIKELTQQLDEIKG